MMMMLNISSRNRECVLVSLINWLIDWLIDWLREIFLEESSLQSQRILKILQIQIVLVQGEKRKKENLFSSNRFGCICEQNDKEQNSKDSRARVSRFYAMWLYVLYNNTRGAFACSKMYGFSPASARLSRCRRDLVSLFCTLNTALLFRSPMEQILKRVYPANRFDSRSKYCWHLIVGTRFRTTGAFRVMHVLFYSGAAAPYSSFSNQWIFTRSNQTIEISWLFYVGYHEYNCLRSIWFNFLAIKFSNKSLHRSVNNDNNSDPPTTTTTTSSSSIKIYIISIVVFINVCIDIFKVKAKTYKE